MAKEYFLTAARKSENITAPLFSLLTNFECDDTVVQFQRRRKLIEQLRDQPFHASSLGWLKLIADDPSSEPCGLNPKFWKPLFEAALSNRSLAGNWKAHVATIAANYYAQSLGDWGRANRLMLDATRADPENPVFYYNHAQLLMTTGKRKIAAALLQRADTLDKLRRYRQASDRLHEQLDRLPT